MAFKTVKLCGERQPNDGSGDYIIIAIATASSLRRWADNWTASLSLNT